MARVIICFWLFLAACACACAVCDAFATNDANSNSNSNSNPKLKSVISTTKHNNHNQQPTFGFGFGIRRHPSSTRSYSQSTLRSMSSVTDADNLADRAKAMNDRATDGTAFTKEELDDIIASIKNICPKDGSMDIDFDALRDLVSNVAHLSHKDWTRTGKNSEELAKILLPDGMSEAGRQLLHRIVQEGSWGGAEKHAAAEITNDLPWAVLVTGVNGIRKTTSIYQPWFPALLSEALVAPPGAKAAFDECILPSGQTGFFRQLGELFTLCHCLSHNTVRAPCVQGRLD